MKKHFIVFLMILSVLCFSTRNIYVFYAWDCSHCKLVLDGELQNLLSEFNPVYHYYDTTYQSNMEILYDIEEHLNIRDAEFPEIIVGNRLFTASEINSDELFDLLRKNKKIDLTPDLKDLIKDGVRYDEPKWGKPEIITDAIEREKKVHLAYFYEPGCPECRKVDRVIQILKERYDLTVDNYDLPKNIPLFEALEMRFDIEERYRLGFPKIFIGDDIMFPDSINIRSLEDIILKYPNGADPYWRYIEITDDIKQSIFDRFQGFKLGAIIVAGLIDGINPCAFTTMLFFISFLTLIKRTKKEILLTGISFTVAIFLSYFLIGIGLVVLFKSLVLINIIAKIIYLGMGALVFVFAILSFYDYIMFKKGRQKDAKLQLPDYMKKKAHSIIRKGKNAKNIIITAFFTGILISLVEFVCTGQVYLPTITFVIQVPELRAKAIWYLIIYNFFFILPLIAIFILAFFGISSEKFNEFYLKLGPSVKLVTGIFFLLLAFLLVMLAI